ncbi:MAG: TolC family protein [Acidobacteria bacterium]|nr:MAG: TolC family protein [Acidobacteriota bacterium]
MKRIATTLSLVLALGAGGPAFGQTVLTLPEAIERGLAASHRLAEIEARRTGAEAAVAGREATSRPQVSAQAGYMRTNHVTAFAIPSPATQRLIVVYPDVPDNFRTRLDFQWPIFTFGRTDALERAARAEAKAVGLDLQAARNDLKLEITRAFWAVVTGNESVRVVTASLDRMESALNDMRNRLKVGLVPPNDVLSMEAQRSRQQVLLIQARNAYDVALADLRRLVGLDPDAPLQVSAVFEPPAPAQVPPPALVRAAREARPERQALSSRIEGAGDQREAAAASRRPIIALGAGVDYARPNTRIFPRAPDWNESWDVSVNFAWNFLDFGRASAETAQAAAGQLALRRRLDEFDSVLDLEVRQRRIDLDSALASIPAASDAVRSATEARRVVAERFAAGVATSTEVLDAQVALLQAELDRTLAIAGARLAEARLERALGR